MEFNFIELPKFNLEEHELKTLTEKWVYFIKNAESLEVVPENIDDEGLKSAYEDANVQTWTQEELDAYDYSFMREEDERARLDKVKETSKNEGKEEGKKETKINTILKLHDKGKSADDISDLMDIPIEEVIQVIENHKSR